MLSVLLVDDEPITKVGVRKLMTRSTPGFELAGTASNGLEALRFVEEHPVDIVITDLKMPQMDGLALIHSLKARDFGGAILVLSNYSDFELVREALLAGAVDYMLKVNITAELLRAQLEKAAERIAEALRSAAEHDRVLAENKSLMRSSVLRDYFSAPVGEAAPPEEELPEAGGPVRLHLLDIFVWPQSAKGKKLPVEGILELLASIFEQAPPTTLVMQPNELLCLVPGPARLNAEARAGQVVRQLAMYYDLTVVVFLPEATEGLEAARRAYAVCQAAHDLLFYGSGWGVVRAAAVKFAPLPADFRSGAVAGEMRRLHAGREALAAYLDGLLERCAAARVAPDELRHFFFRVLEKLVLAASPGGDEPVPQPGGAVLESPSAAGLRKRLLDLLPGLLERALPASAAGYKKEVKDALLYISFHYNEKLTLEDIAGAVSLNASYLCRVFKKETGDSLFHYIGRLRMERAARLMDQGNTYIREVAAMVGIDDQFYFARLFKKHYGVSPTEYQAMTQ